MARWAIWVVSKKNFASANRSMNCIPACGLGQAQQKKEANDLNKADTT